MAVLVTGGCGFIGSHLVDALIESGREVIVVDDLSTGKRENLHPKAFFVQGDIVDPNLFGPLMKSVDACFHLAAIASVERSKVEWYRTHQVNIGGTVNLMHAIAATGRSIPVVYASSAAVYGDSARHAIAESTPTRPLTAYGIDKLACEYHGQVGANIHNIPNVGLRFFNVYGPRQCPKSPYSGVISIFSERISRGLPITIYGDGGQSRDFVFVQDVVQCLMRSMQLLRIETIHQGVFNVCTGVPTTVRDLADTIGRLAGVEPVIQFEPSRKGDIRFSLGDATLIRSVLGYQPATPLGEGLRQLLDYAAPSATTRIAA